MVDFTVAICTYNGEKRLPDVLDRLRSQIDPENISWEIIVVDNNSSDRTADVVRQYQSNWNEVYPLKYCFEPEQGLAIARQRAVEEGQGTFIGFLDDDNLPKPNWLKAAYVFGQSHPQAGAYGSRIYGEFEVTPPKNFERISRFLAIGGGSKTICYTSSDYKYYYKKVLPPGAGIVVCKQAWLKSVPKRLLLQGRVSGLQLPGDDLEAFLYLRRAGWEIWYNPDMEIYHKIPKQRLQRAYLIKLMRGIGLSRYHTRMLSWKPWQKPFMLILYMINDIRKIVIHIAKYGTLYKIDPVYAAEKELMINSLFSPFYSWKQSILNHQKS